MKPSKPHVTLKLAMSIDGYLDNETPFRFSNAVDRLKVQQLRGEVDAILIASRTLNNDNPSLLVTEASVIQDRLKKGIPSQPMRIVLCGRSSINIESKLLSDNQAQTVIFKPQNLDSNKIENEFVRTKTYPGSNIKMDELCEEIYQLGVRKLLVEGGASLALQFLESRLVDHLRIAYSPTIIGNLNATRISPVCMQNIESSSSQIENLAGMYAQNFYF